MKQLQVLLVILVIIVSFKFFDAQFINPSIVNYSLYICLIGVVIISLPYVAPLNKGFVFPVQLLFISFIISIIMANLYWDQSLKDSVIATMPYFVVIFFFYLLHTEFPVKRLEQIIVGFGLLYILLYFFQLANSPTVLFGKSLWGDEFSESRGITRIIFPGGGVFVLTTFIAINKLTSKNNYKWFWGILAICGILIPILQVTRQFIAGILLLYLYHAIRTLSITKKTLIFVSLIGVFFYLSTISNPIIDGLLESTESDASLGSDYIRVLAGEFFLFDFSPNLITSIFGNGVPYTGTSNYGLYIDMITETRYFFLSDVGVIAVYAMFGLLAVIAFVIMWIKSFTMALPKEYQYLKYYLWFLILTSFTWYTTYYYHYLLITIIVLYMYQSIYYKKKSEYRQAEIEREKVID